MDLVQFLKTLVEQRLSVGMIPRVDPATGEPQVGALDWPELVRLVERVRGAGRRRPGIRDGGRRYQRLVSSQTRIPGGWNAVGNC